MNPLMMSNPYLMIAGVGLSMLGSYQAGKAEKNRQNAIAAQREQDAKLMQLQSEQEHNERQGKLDALLRMNEAARAVNNRGSNDRSLNALTRASKKQSATSDSRARLQTMLGQSRSRFAAADAKASGNQAMRSALFQAVGTGIQGADAYGKIG
jgi:hypothetical protein